jgi:hypothetical protein
MPAHVRCQGRFSVALPPEHALGLFTPEGERRWVAGWDPRYPAPERTDGPGAVFTTAAHGATTIWVMTARSPTSVAYVRITPGVMAGTVTVVCHGMALDASSDVEVIYDLTALTPDGESILASFESGYAAFLADWEQQVAKISS